MLPSDGSMDWGEVEIFWTAAGAAWNPDAAIFADWLAKRRAGVNYGTPIGQERGFDDGARVVQPFSTDFIAQWTKEDGRTTWLGTLPMGSP